MLSTVKACRRQKGASPLAQRVPSTMANAMHLTCSRSLTY